MAKIFIPVSTRPEIDAEKTIAELREAGASRVYFSLDERFAFECGGRRRAVNEIIKKNVELYTNAGFDVGMWIDTVGFGGAHTSYNARAAAKYTPIRAITGVNAVDAFCPMDERFSDMMAKLIEDLCRDTGLRMLMLDDELCMSVRPGIGCACDSHLAELSRRMGEKIELSDIAKKCFSGAPSRLRSEWIRLMGDTMRSFCRKIREAVNRVDPTIRLGFCSGYTSWDIEGADALELTEILAEENEPFLRFTGAPYWFAKRRFGQQTLQTVIETARMQYAWCRGRGIETFTESDTYPRDRFHTPAAYSECFDIGTRLSDGMDNLKYLYNYHCQPDFDGGYFEAHVRHMPLYREISEVFDNKNAVGVRIYSHMRRLENAELPEFPCGSVGEMHAHEKKLMAQMIFPAESKILTPHAIPTVYDGEGICGIAFGENARYLPDAAFDKLLMLDAKAARILTQKGIDVGLRSYEKMNDAFMEHFENGEGPDVQLFDTSSVCRISVDDSAQILSRFTSVELYDDTSYIASYYYKNKEGQQFLVFAFDADDTDDSSSLFWSYCRGIQIARAIDRYCEEKLPVRCEKHPQLYCIAKQDENALAAGFINCHPDEIFNARVMLAQSVKTVRFINCEGRLENGNTVVIEHIAPFGFAGIEVKK